MIQTMGNAADGSPVRTDTDSLSWAGTAVVVLAALVPLVIVVVNSVGSISPHAASKRADAFIAAVRADIRVSNVDYSQVPTRDLVAAGEAVSNEVAGFACRR
jgi:hypothetical protein